MFEKLDPKTDGSSKDIVQDNIQQLKQLFPDVFAEDKVDFDALRNALGDYVETAEERYNFTWHGKSQAKRIAQTPSTGTLRPCKEESKDWDTTENLFIEGDNLEVLKLLQKAYHKQVKMIYIDPPYNTGKEFIYPDNYQDNLDTYLEYTGQKDNEGRKFGTNTEATGRYHTNWLNMMYPRLKLSRNLLKEDGAICISIDENEAANLKRICDEIFGEENFISQAGWQKVYSPKNQARYLSNDYEFVLIYAKNLAEFKMGLLPRTEEMNKRYQNPDNDPRGVWKPGDLVAAGERSGGHYIIKNPFTGAEYDVPPGKHWAFSEPSMRNMLNDNRIFWGKNQNSFPSFKQFLSEVKQGRVASSLFSYKDFGHTDEAKKDFIKLFGEEGKTIFETIKPVKLIKQLFRITNVQGNELIMDFFAGTATTAQAVFELNIEESKFIKFIAVQLPEVTDEKSPARTYGYDFVSDIGKERIRRAGEKIKADNSDKDGIDNLDIGFKVFKLDSSNIKPWDTDIDQLEQGLFDSVNNIKNDRTAEDVLYELLLKYGIDLTIPIETHSIADKTVYSVGLGALIICLDDAITLDVIEGIGKLKEQLQPEVMHVVLKDAGLKDDVVKTNAIQILKRYDIQDVKTL